MKSKGTNEGFDSLTDLEAKDFSEKTKEGFKNTDQLMDMIIKNDILFKVDRVITLSAKAVYRDTFYHRPGYEYHDRRDKDSHKNYKYK